MKRFNKLLTLPLAGVVTIPLVCGISSSQTTKTTLTYSSSINDEKSIDEKCRCTITYIGKKCAADGLPIIARTADGQTLSQSHLIKVQHNQLANKTITNINGFEYKLPSETYAYIAAPDCPKTDTKTEGNQYQNFAFNEMGVGLSCTLSCYSNKDTVLAEGKDPFVESGLCEEIMNQCIIPHAKTAKEAMLIAADIIDKHGNAEGNIIMAVDQKEAWLMEMYSGHQYCAIKLPDDKVCVAGNEFILNTLDDLGINESNKDEMCITSPDLLKFVVDNGFDKYDDSGTKDIYHLHLFNSYAQPLAVFDPITGEEKSNTDYSHMRTWRGYSLFDPSGTIAQSYGCGDKYPPFFVPKDKNGNVRNDITVYDVMNVYRDEFDELINKPGFERFTKAKADGSLRSIATDHARSIHIMTSDPNKAKEFAVNCWYCPSSANYVPYVLLNNGMNSFNDEYSYVPERYGYDDNCASTVFRKLNALAAVDRNNYGLPLQPFWQSFEKIYTKQMQQVIDDSIKLTASKATTILDNFNKHVRHIQIQAVRYVTQDLISHIMDDLHVAPSKHTPFDPLVDLVTYLTDLGWKDFRKNGSIITFKYNDIEGNVDIGEGYYQEPGSITIGNETKTINVRYQDNKVYVDYYTLNELLESQQAYSVKTINIYDYLIKFNHWLWAGPLIAVAMIGVTSVLTFFAVRKKKNSKTVK